MGSKHHQISPSVPPHGAAPDLEKQATGALAARRFRKARDFYKLLCKQDRTKGQLSDEPFVKIREEYIHGELHLETEIQRDEYEAMIEPDLQKTLDCIHQSLQDARLLPGQISKVMLGGGSTRTPLVHRLLEQEPLLRVMGVGTMRAALPGKIAPPQG
jgi:hypothetical protein